MKHQKWRIDKEIFGVENVAKIMADKKHISVHNVTSVYNVRHIRKQSFMFEFMMYLNLKRELNRLSINLNRRHLHVKFHFELSKRSYN